MAGKNILELRLPWKWDHLNISYTFLTDFAYYFSETQRNTFSPFHEFSIAQQDIAESIFAHIQTFTNLQFNKVTQTSTQVGDIALARGTVAGNGVVLPGHGTLFQPGSDGDLWMRHNLSDQLFRQTLLHEIGHALGLSHPAFTGEERGLSYTVMQQDPSVGDPLIPFPSTFMLYDIAVLQNLYGARAHNTGNDVYAYGSSPVRLTIWDTGGTDTLSAVGSSTGAFINLNAGTFSTILNDPNFGPTLHADNIAIAFDVSIEKAVGSSVADIIVGNEVGNTINAGDGNDLIFGDEVTARAIITGNLNYRNWVFVEGFWDRGQYQSYGTTDASDKDVLFGEGGEDHVFAGQGDDEVDGGTGNDFLDGGQGKDIALYDGVTGAVNITQLRPADVPDGVQANGSPVFRVSFKRDGNGEADRLRDFELAQFGDGIQRVVAEGDFNIGQGGYLRIDGGDGSNILDFSKAVEVVTSVETIDGVEHTTFGNIAVTGFETIVGSADNDELRMGDGDQKIYGGGGYDILSGGAGNDILDGGGGDDVLEGGAGGDTFIIGLSGEGGEVILDADASDRLFIRLSTITGSDPENSAEAEQLVPITGGFFLYAAWEQPPGATLATHSA
jgi:serralysin